jgi:predicted RNase H-like HicB family nuclease
MTQDDYRGLPYRLEIIPLPKDEGGGYYAHYTDFAVGTAHGDGATIEEAVKEAQISLELTLEDMLEQGLTIPEPEPFLAAS